MKSAFEEYRNLLGRSFECACGKRHEVPIRQVVIENGALQKLPEVLQCLEYTGKIHMVADIHTDRAAGQLAKSILEERNFPVNLTLYEDKSLAADENALQRLIREIAENTACVIAVGSGTINDISRYAAFKLHKPYIIIATAPSMDGYASSVSPLIIGGFKNTYSAVAPQAIIGDLDILCKAPDEMTAAGFGDLIGKVVCQNDWKLGNILNGEYYCEFVSGLIYKAVEACTSNMEGLRMRNPEAIEALMHGLILSGIGMLMVGNSRPASGCEHHLSHFWEMRFLQEGREQVLHGQKVGVSSILMARVYNKLARYSKSEVQSLLQAKIIPSKQRIIEKIRKNFGTLSEEVLNENFSNPFGTPDSSRILEKWGQINEVLMRVPAFADIYGMLSDVNAPCKPEELGIEFSLLKEGMENCMYVRNRYTALRLADELDILEQVVGECIETFDSHAPNPPL